VSGVEYENIDQAAVSPTMEETRGSNLYIRGIDGWVVAGERSQFNREPLVIAMVLRIIMGVVR